MKRLCFLLFIPLLLVLTSCTNVDVAYRLLDDHTVSLDYSLEIPADDENLKGYINTISDYWESMEFAVETDILDDAYRLSGEKSISSDTKELAAEEFSSLLTQEDSLFYDVDFSYQPSFEADEYSLSASISLENIIRQQEIQNIPAEEITILRNNAQNGEYKLSFSLPGEIISTNANEQDGQVCTWNLNFDEVTHISMQTKKTNDENIEYYAKLKDDYDNDVMLFTIFGVVGVALFLALILALIIRLIHKKRSSKFRKQQF